MYYSRRDYSSERPQYSVLSTQYCVLRTIAILQVPYLSTRVRVHERSREVDRIYVVAIFFGGNGASPCRHSNTKQFFEVVL